MQQGQPDDEDKELGASWGRKTSIAGGNLSGGWVLKDWGTGSFLSEWPGLRDLVRSRRRKTKTEERAGGRVKRRADGPEGGAERGEDAAARAGKRGNRGGHQGPGRGPGAGGMQGAAGRPARRCGN